jgi:hypothetical protein
MLLESFVLGLAGVVGRQTRFSNPQTIEDALRVALSVQEAEKQERFNESFYKFENSVRLLCRSPDRSHSGNEGQHQTTDSRAVNRPRGQRLGTSGKTVRSEVARSRGAQTDAALRCYECRGIGHYARQCPTRQNREAKVSDSPGKRRPTERSKRSCPRGDRHPLVSNQGTKWEDKKSENYNEA